MCKANVIIGLLLEDDPDFDADEYMGTPMTGGVDRRIRISFTQYTPESLENGDSSDSGWINEEGIEMDPDEWDIEDDITAVDKAVKFLETEGARRASSSHFNPGVNYSTNVECIDHSTCTDEEKSYFLDNYTVEEEREIFKQMTQRRAY